MFHNQVKMALNIKASFKWEISAFYVILNKVPLSVEFQIYFIIWFIEFV